MAVTRSRFFREDFDRGRDFVVNKPFIMNGKGLVPGQTLDKTLFTVRRLRQLYDQRFVEHEAEEPVSFVAPVPKVLVYPPVVPLSQPLEPMIPQAIEPKSTGVKRRPLKKPVVRRRVAV